MNTEEKRIVEFGHEISDLLSRYGNPDMKVVITDCEVRFDQTKLFVPIKHEGVKK